MPGQPIVTEEFGSFESQHGRFAGSTLSDYWALTKPEVNFLILITTGVGFYLGSRDAARPLSFLALFNTLLGTLLVASGTGTLNQYIERKFDAQMRRTARRPAAAGRLKPAAVLAFGIVLAGTGSVYLAAAVNPLTSVLVYTPLKRKTPLCVLVGAFPGAMPPLIGWAGASGRLSIEAGILFAILFLWQFPHFMAIAWMYREDYDRAGYLVLPKGNMRIPFVTLETLLPLLALIAISIVQFPTRHAAIVGCAGALLSVGYLYFGLEFVFQRSRAAARRLLAASIVYLPLLFALTTTLCNRARR
ncbi:MAG: protoheme IX farnesyltransferase [Acidobacteria bacterium]|nr:MAG: protoheme IX farnesyltransferase [Acidobacteriota bacterium]